MFATVDRSSSYDKDVPFFVSIFESPVIHITTSKKVFGIRRSSSFFDILAVTEKGFGIQCSVLIAKSACNTVVILTLSAR